MTTSKKKKKKENKIKRTTNRRNNVDDKELHQEDMWMFFSLVFISHPSSDSGIRDLHFISAMPDVVTFSPSVFFLAVLPVDALESPLQSTFLRLWLFFFSSSFFFFWHILFHSIDEDRD